MWISIVAKEKTLDPDETLDVLTRLRRVAKTPEERKRADDLIDGINRQRAQAAGATQPVKPTPELLARQLEDADPKARTRGLLFLLQAAREDFVIRPPLTQALLKRLDPGYEPDAPNRILALGVFARFASRETAPLVRIPIWNASERDGRVRAKAADVLAELGNPLGIAALAPAALSKDEELARRGTRSTGWPGRRRARPRRRPRSSRRRSSSGGAAMEARDAKRDRPAGVAADVRPYELGWALVTDPTKPSGPRRTGSSRARGPGAKGAARGRCGWRRCARFDATQPVAAP
jgi:hypothetical protein